MTNLIYNTYKNTVILHICHINKTAADIAIDAMFDFPSYQHDIPHWKCVLPCCSKSPSIVTAIQ